MLFIVHYHDTVTLGSLVVGLLLGGAGLATFGYGVRWKTAFEAEKAARESCEERHDTLEKSRRVERERDRTDLRIARTARDREAAEKLELSKALAAERTKTDLTAVLEKMAAGFRSVVDEVSSGRDAAVGELHKVLVAQEERALDRHTETVAVLKEIRDSLRKETP